MDKAIKISVLPFLCVLLSACISPPPPDSLSSQWPEGLPSRDLFLDYYHRDSVNRAQQSEADYLKWVERFYRGWAFSPAGWNQLSVGMLAAIEDYEQRLQVKIKLEKIAQRASAEWAKGSNHRRIDSRHLLVWGEALQLSRQQDATLRITEHIDRDVEALLSHRLAAEDIQFQRYFPAVQSDPAP